MKNIVDKIYEKYSHFGCTKNEIQTVQQKLVPLEVNDFCMNEKI